MRNFSVKLKHDNGFINIKTTATSKMQAIDNVLQAEGCPVQAIVMVYDLEMQLENGHLTAKAIAAGKWDIYSGKATHVAIRRGENGLWQAKAENHLWQSFSHLNDARKFARRVSSKGL